MPKTEIDYSKTIIYKIYCDCVDEIYVGNTTNFRKRKNLHKCSCNNQKNNKIYQTIRNNGGWEKWNMVEIEIYPCKSSTEARIREEYWRSKLNASMNMIKAYISKEQKKIYQKDYCEENKDTIKIYKKNYCVANQDILAKEKKEWYELNKTSILEKRKIYREENRKLLAEKTKETYLCDCGITVTKCNKARHLISKKHLTVTAIENNYIKID